MEQPGGYGKAYHQSFHDPCKVRAAVFDDGKTRVAIVGIDALFIRRQTVQSVRAAIQKRCGIEPQVDPDQRLAHAFGRTDRLLPARRVRRRLASGAIADPRSDGLCQSRVSRQGRDGASSRRSARPTPSVPRPGAAWPTAVEDKVAFNRRFRMKDGFTMTHPGQGNPGDRRAGGPIDPQVGVLGAWDAEGKFLGCIVNFACHATTGPGGISADYIYYVEKTIRGLMGDQAVVVFLPGAAGDVTQVDNRSPYQIKQFGEVSARFVGGRVGAEAAEGAAGDGARGRTARARGRARPGPQDQAPAAPAGAREQGPRDRQEGPQDRATPPSGPSPRRPWCSTPGSPASRSWRSRSRRCRSGPRCSWPVPPSTSASSAWTSRRAASSRSPSRCRWPTTRSATCRPRRRFGPRGGGYETRLTSYSNHAGPRWVPDTARKELDGVSLLPLLMGKGNPDRDAIFWHYPHDGNQGGLPGGAIRLGDWEADRVL